YPREQKSLYAPPFKIIHDVERGTWELFDIAHDRGEIVNLYDDRPEITGPMRERLLSWAESASLPSNRDSEAIAAARLPREPPMQHPVHIAFGDIVELLGYDLPTRQFAIGSYFRATY